MAIRHPNHGLGSRAELRIMTIFEELGYACSKITPDYGEDFFVFGESDGIIEPFKLFVQVKSSAQVDQVPSDWTEYEDPLTVRNWVLANELMILVRHNHTSGETRYCVPEDDIVYWEIDPHEKVPLHCSTQFDADAARTLIWRARIRHYDRIVRITQPNHFEKSTWRDVPHFRLFVREFLSRLSFLDHGSGHLADDVFTLQLPLTLHMLQEEQYEDSPDMTALEKARYSACVLLVLTRLQKVSGCTVGLMPFFLDQCACLLVQLIHHRIDHELASCGDTDGASRRAPP